MLFRGPIGSRTTAHKMALARHQNTLLLSFPGPAACEWSKEMVEKSVAGGL